MKDNIEVAGPAGQRGNAGAERLRSGEGCARGGRLREAGAVILGKTNMHELAFGISGYNAAFKTGAESGYAMPTIRENRRRIVVGIGRGGRRADRHRRSRNGYRRLGQGPLCAQRMRSVASNRGALSRRGDRADLAHPRHRRADGCPLSPTWRSSIG